MDETKYRVTREGDDVLAHHGIKGMKWGVRRFQNSDGTLTAAGRRRVRKYQSMNRPKYRKVSTDDKNRTMDLLRDNIRRSSEFMDAFKRASSAADELKSIKKRAQEAVDELHANKKLHYEMAEEAAWRFTLSSYDRKPSKQDIKSAIDEYLTGDLSSKIDMDYVCSKLGFFNERAFNDRIWDLRFSIQKESAKMATAMMESIGGKEVNSYDDKFNSEIFKQIDELVNEKLFDETDRDERHSH